MRFGARPIPREEVPANNLGVIYQTLGQYDKAVDAFEETRRVALPDALLYSNLVLTNINLNRFKEAGTTAEEAQANNFDSPSLHIYLYQIAFLQNDTPRMLHQVSRAMGKPGQESTLLYFEAQTAAYSGLLSKAREFTRQALDASDRAQQIERTAGIEASAALTEALFGNVPEAKQRVAVGLSNGRDAQFVAALAFAIAKDSAQAQGLAEDLEKRFPEDTIVRFNYLPAIRAQLALNRNEAAKALEMLRAATPYELGLATGGASFLTYLYPVYVRGAAYLGAQNGAQAAAEFQKILDHRGVVLNEPIGALAHLQIGRAYAMQGDTAKAKAAYQDFLTLWRDADTNIPILIAAKSEYAKLR